ncbi:MAG TPA: protein kinase, partial [Gemmatimonadales bacterium]|nr:protein kinase [Gemmatimonadales bacterium]
MSNTPAAGLTAPDDAVALPTELDARRELAREFQIEDLLGQAPILYLARDAEDRALAIKVVPRGQFEESVAEVLEPVVLAKRLDHPHIARVYGSGATHNFLWYATRHVEGRTLATLLRTVGSMELAACLRIFEQVASALDYAHRRGVSHGALTAECVVVDANEWVVVSDFGAAELFQSAPPGDVSPASDQRALALLVRQCLTGGSVPASTRSAPSGRGEAGLPLHVSQALRRAMSARAADQFPSVLDLVAALDDRRAVGGGAAPPEARPAWFGSKPHSTRKGGTPVVIADADQDPAATSHAGGRVVAVAALVGVFAVAAIGISRWSATPPAPASAAQPSRARPSQARADPPPSPVPAPVQAAPPDSAAAPVTPPRAAPAP